jgi:HPt (histidine-containing phosphotransfer) domain-containing protein
MNPVTLRKSSPVLKGTLQLPYSKSISNRLLIIRALSPGGFQIHNLSDAGDTILLCRLLDTITGQKDLSRMIVLDTDNAGTAMRFLTAFLAFRPGKWILTGSERMRERPVGILVDALKPLGAKIEYLADLGFPPLMIKGSTLKGGEVIIDPGQLGAIVGDDRAAARRYLDLYATTASELMGRVGGAVGGRDAPGLRELAHNLKGSSGNVGAILVARLSAELEQVAEAGDWGAAEQCYRELQSAFDRTVAHAKLQS